MDKRLIKGRKRSEETKAKMSRAAKARWADSRYRALHSKIMTERWAAVHRAIRIIEAAKKSFHLCSENGILGGINSAQPKKDPSRSIRIVSKLNRNTTLSSPHER